MEFSPLSPFEPVSADTIPEGGSWITQIKWDGVRMLTYYDGQETRLINRKGNDRTLQYPELTEFSGYCSAGSAILDGEIVALAGGKPSFHEVMRRDGARKAASISFIRKAVPVIYMVFDILHCDGEWLTELPLKDRQERLRSVLLPQPGIQMVENYTDGAALMGVMDEHDMEGVVAKDLTSSYVLGGKDRRWQKIKRFHDLYAVVGGMTHKEGRFNALMLGLYDASGTLWHVGDIGPGQIGQADWAGFTQQAAKFATERRPFHNVPEKAKQATWLTPGLTVKVSFLTWTPGKTLRHPVLQGIGAVPPESCTFDQT